MINLPDFNYSLPEELIAHNPIKNRDKSRLLILNRKTKTMYPTHFADIVSYLYKGDVLVLNDSKVYPARFTAHTIRSKNAELLLIDKTSNVTYSALFHAKSKIGDELFIDNQVKATIVKKNIDNGTIEIEFEPNIDINDFIYTFGKMPLPHYIKTSTDEKELQSRYQTVYAKRIGSVAAPTAGLHFTNKLLKELQNKGIEIAFVTLHVGMGTFSRVWKEQIKSNRLHKEKFEISEKTSSTILRAKNENKRVIAVGTTTTRVLESASALINNSLTFTIGPQTTDLFINPPYQFKVVDGLITNFHLPQSSLLMLVTAFTTWPQNDDMFIDFTSSLLGKAYNKAIKNKLKFYSFGDAMFIT